MEGAVLNRKHNQNHTEESTIGSPMSAGIQARFLTALTVKTKNSETR
jgi:hypothetical protein